ncbi:hypothetical protein EET67_12785 [Pseudaminobacter arsenicus]|uniref:Flagellar protein FlgN n=1 Tax=Borborobacter arsenicus TaxID=1851146 RepID=A0A432V5T3_9HYPH|nr:hypothetical protein [Pseudaminobacter arsenicus]RUM97522.1 hypothetical protein EET67_12785 [Pseudaminobacter arsenicus]
MTKQTSNNLPAHPAAVPTAAARLGNLPAIISRISRAVEEETAAIRAGADYDMKSSNARKSRYLYELTRATKGVGDAEALAQYRADIEQLRQLLASNETVIRAHMSAVSEVADLMQDVIQRAEADGTYSALEFGRAP